MAVLSRSLLVSTVQAALAWPLYGANALHVGTLLQHHAHYFDLQDKRVSFRPRTDATYDVRVSPFLGRPDSGTMGGMAVEDAPGGGHRSLYTPSGAPKGLAWLDLYSMGLVGPEEVFETYFISASVEPDAEGMRQPLRFQIYMLHEDGREVDPKAIAAAREMEALARRQIQRGDAGPAGRGPDPLTLVAAKLCAQACALSRRGTCATARRSCPGGASDADWCAG